MVSELIGDRPSVLRALRKLYSAETRQVAWERAKKIAAARNVSPQKVNWDFCLFMAEIKRRAK